MKKEANLKAKFIQEELEVVRAGCLNQNWEVVIDGIGVLKYVISGTAMEVGIPVDMLLNPSIIEGTMISGLRAIPKIIKQ